jgi:hypothetical protein
MRHILFFLLSIGSVSVLAEPIPPHLGEWDFTDSASYFKSSGNFATSGTSSTDLINNGSFTAFDDTLGVSYDAFTSMRFSVNLGYANTSSSNNFTSYSGNGMSEGGASAQYWFRDKRWALVPTVSAEFPFYRNSTTQTSSYLGNGAVYGEGGGWGLLYYHPVTIYAYVGYRYQDSGLASLLMNDIGASYRFNVARIRVGVRGESTITNDNDTGNLQNTFNRNLQMSLVQSGSMKYYSMNPTLWEGYGEADWLFTRMIEAGLGFSQTFYGNNSAFGWTVTGFFRFRLPTKEARHESTSGGSEYGEAPPITEPIFAPVGTEEDTPTPTRKGRRAPPRQQKTIDQMMQETEKSLEKKN